MTKLNLAGFIICIILIAIVVIMNSCTTYRCYPSKRSKDYAGAVLLDGTIAQANEYRRTTLVKVIRTMKGYRHLFVSDDGDTATLYLYPALTKDSCYLVKTVNFS